ncbi:CidA/LrgA family holin-like protein [Domibacillus epiphyticus]|uniref:Holin n=1 Tax=Domibacillus epiphyticus TaxID=1714355 RepID=A0A1V2ABK5_9BACI|nr:CidA/LrgA family holin-like protein [Domibacillus epiphyticus]OMP68369.1 holin [Domibacillus epiphyticus]
MKWMVMALQAGVLYVISLVGNQIADWLNLSIPGSLIGMILLFILLTTGILPSKWVEMGALKLVAFMPLFLIPATTGVIDYGAFFLQEGIGLVVVIIGSTLMTLAVSAFVSDRLARKEEQQWDGS